MGEIGWPSAFRTKYGRLRLPPTVMREFAGVYGVEHGLTHQTGDQNGVLTFADTKPQDAFRHAFVHGLKALERVRQRQGYRQSIGVSGASQAERFAARVFEGARREALEWGFDNERFARNNLPQHLQDFWNNGVGTDLAWEYLRDHNYDTSNMTNDTFAAYVAGKIKAEPERFILDPTHDPRANDPERFDERYLPPDAWSIFETLGDLRGNDSSVRDRLRVKFPERYPKAEDRRLRQGGSGRRRASASDGAANRFGTGRDATAGQAGGQPGPHVDATPVAVVVPQRAGKEQIVSMRADMPVTGRDGRATTIRRFMEADGYALDADFGAFRAPGAPDRELRWFDWREAKRPFDRRHTLDAPIRWVLPK